jgi:hypothetical protein
MAKKTGTETALAQCYLRYEKGKADPRHHAYLTKSKLYLRKNSTDYEMYSLKDIVGIKTTQSYIWILLILGSFLILTALANDKYEIFPTKRPLRYYYNNETQLYLETYANPQDWEVANKEWKSENGNWTGGLVMVGIVIFLTGLKKRSSLKLLMNNRELGFRVYVVTNEYLHFVEVLKSRVGFVPKE